MKKLILLGAISCLTFGSVHAQLSEGGIPWSASEQTEAAIRVMTLPTPDFKTILENELEDQKNGVAKPYMVSAFVAMNVDLMNSGTWTYLENGDKIWQLKVAIPGAKAIDFFYDRFRLPEGVRLYLSNENGKQLLGAYTASNNTALGLFTNQAVQGDLVVLEMNVPAGINASDIVFHINKAGAYYRGVENLTNAFGQVADLPDEAKPTVGESSDCHINATCEIPTQPHDYFISRNATVRIVVVNSAGAGYCSGTLINNTGNVENGTCVPYLLTASHCDGSNSHSDADFAQWKFNFNYQYDSCDQSLNNNHSKTLTGAKFRARSYYPSLASTQEVKRLVGDFLLVELNESIPTEYNAYLAGWNRSSDVLMDPTYNFFIGFHHPMGDIKKVSAGSVVYGNGTFNQNQVPGTHYDIPFDYGGSEPGSSGSGLFDVNGRVIGDLSGGSSVSSSCGPEYGVAGLYSKISYAWENDFDQTTFPSFAGSQSQLKDWLDPTGSGVEAIPAAKATTCESTSAIEDVSQEVIDGSILLYPNPAVSGLVYAKFNFPETIKTLKVTVVNALGVVQQQYELKNAGQGEVTFDCSDLAGGIYLFNFDVDGGAASATKKVVITK